MTTFSTQANPAQLKAITTTDGPLLIIAGPGSGKTFTLVERVVYLITEKGATPESLFVSTFTDKAAQELRTRVSNRLNALGIRFNLNEMYLGTFHSICLRWLRDYREHTRLKRNFSMMDQFDQQYFVYQRMRDYESIAGIEHLVGSHRQSDWHKSESLVIWLNKVSEEALEADTLIAADEEAVRVLGQCYALYQEQLDAENALDFATIQYEALKLLRGHSAILAELRGQISYLMVDEYQDTNTIQEMLLTLLAGPNPNLCVVGDDDQGLYRFRGATIRNILEFKGKFPPGECAQVTLQTNYRSHPDIIDAYNGWIDDQNWHWDGQTFRYDKQIVPREAEFPAVPGALQVMGPTAAEWHAEVLRFLRALREQGQLTDWNQVAFLFRSVKNPHAVALARFLEQNDIPVYAPRSNQFFEREEVRLMIGALIFLFPQFQTVRKWNADAELDIWAYYDEQCFRPFGEQLRRPENQELLRWARTMAGQHRALARNADYAFSGLFYRLLQFPLFSRYLNEDLLKSRFHDRRPMYNLALFSRLLNKFEYLHNISVLTPDYLDKNIRDLFNRFFRYLSEGGINEYEDETEYAPSGCVSFLTIHQSKGLEFPVVLVGSLEAVPRKQHTPLDEVLEARYLSRPPFEPLEQTKYYDFRRLYYTAFSRAQNLLVLTGHRRTGTGACPSKYFADHVDALPTWTDPAFRPEDVSLAQVKEVNLKREYSFTSHITLFENCAEQYRFFKELEFAPVRTSPILFGTLVHQTIEDIHKAVLRGEAAVLSEGQVARWFDTNYVYLTKRERVYLAPAVRDIALEHVLRYYRRNGDDWSHIRDTEVDVSLVKDAYILSGTIDLIAGADDTVETVDFKSEKKLDVNDPADREKLARYRRQLEIYAHIVEERTGQQVSKTHLYYTSEEAGVPTISFDADQRSIERTVTAFDRVVGRIEAGDFAIPERPAKLCADCDMRFYCDLKNWRFCA
ncbi:MAG: ATP-dependent helicase [Anaerolineae bacterium]|nr:ATP-dependent helicase [Anaerolineae bacterium]